ncbi:ATP-binding protein [Paenibacillus kyungheensis]|uniref:ATP-binding protein n=1 Tax=Paenibacillus kyungheensis TaxID=1452732 RepID=A0AAX3M3F7_9BACL|nr:ATP-binding protein [Paenibacillus kyungheensis]WCT56650.1 ATP-binding protein [Paenibacillus kyungheensis]
MTFREKIQQLRKGASEAQSATKIIDKLKALKDSNGSDTSYRWIWELIQNAKDVVNASGLVDIEIKFSEVNKTIEFNHNGRLFTTENIVFLIEQVSTKERSLTAENKKKSTGKFGTGFLTTHLLSEKVHVYGYLQDDNEPPRSFETLLDRTGQDKTTIMKAISDSCDMLDTGKECSIDESQMNTRFVYELNEVGIETAKLGLKNLLISIPYVFAFVPELNSITFSMDDYKKVIQKGQEVAVKLESANATQVQILTSKGENTTSENRYVFVKSNNEVSIAVEIKKNDKGEKHLIEPHKELPRIFCDFPLLGTHDFSFPVVVNSPLFNPTEPRDGVPLIHSERSGGDSEENRNRIIQAINVYNDMLDYFAKEGYKDLYNIVKISAQPEKNWLDSDWVEKVLIHPIKEHIKTTTFIHNSSDEVCSLYDVWDTPIIFIMKDETPEYRSKVWELSNMLMPKNMTRKDEIENWYNSLWVECRNFGIVDLIKEVEECGNLVNLSTRLGYDSIKWLNDLIVLLYHNSSKYIAELGRHPSILPNQYGDFLPLDRIHAENNIGETYKDIALIAGVNFRERLLDNRVSKDHLQGLQEINLKDVFNELIQDHINQETKLEFYKAIINLRASKNEKQNEFVEIANYLYQGCFDRYTEVRYFNERLLSDALKFWREKICIDLNDCTSISSVMEQYDFQNEREVAEWISKLVNHFRICEHESLLDKYAILPNQNGYFMHMSEIFLDDGSVNEILKDAAMYSDNDIRKKMLFKGIALDLPLNRIISLESVAPAITAYVRNNNKFIRTQNSEFRETFRNTCAWIRNNRKDSKVSKYFKELIENLHWFYDDEEIAESMAKSERYDEVLKKYNVADVNELANILASQSSVGSETISISIELLAQWGISSEAELQKALSKNVFGSAQIHYSKSDPMLFSYVKDILNRSRTNIVNFLDEHDDYEFDKDNLQLIKNTANTIFRVRKLGQEIYIIARPSDFEQIILYYDTEIDLLDFDKDCELWVENEADPTPKKITLGRILKLTGVNKIPLRSLKNND